MQFDDPRRTRFHFQGIWSGLLCGRAWEWIHFGVNSDDLGGASLFVGAAVGLAADLGKNRIGSISTIGAVDFVWGRSDWQARSCCSEAEKLKGAVGKQIWHQSELITSTPFRSLIGNEQYEILLSTLKGSRRTEALWTNAELIILRPDEKTKRMAFRPIDRDIPDPQYRIDRSDD